MDTTFQKMGIQNKKSVATHLLLENTYDSNLLSDISKTDYLEGNSGQTNLQPLEGLPIFVDDIYVFGYLQSEDTVSMGKRIYCTTGDIGAAKNIVGTLQLAIRQSIGKMVEYLHCNIVHTIRKNSPGIVYSTIGRIEKETDYKARRAWCGIYGAEFVEKIEEQKKVAGVFVAKIDVSELSIETIQDRLPEFQAILQPFGFGLYCIDYTKDFSGVLDRKRLVEHLLVEKNMRVEGDNTIAIESSMATILDNTSSVGGHVCTYISTSAQGYTTRTKIYNKVVSNFEAGEIRSNFGGHLADYADCPNQHLRRTFLHPDVQRRGCTRIEVSLYACRSGVSKQTAEIVVQDAIDMVHTEEGLFVVQPPSKQWENLAKNIDRCVVLSHKDNGSIYVGWYAHTGTGRIAGVHIQPKTEKWEAAVRWAIEDFGFRSCPIFYFSIDTTKPEEVALSKLECYIKAPDSKTILCPSRQPTKIHKNTTPLEELLPSNSIVEWVWRKNKCQRIGAEKSSYIAMAVPTERTISIFSTYKRGKKLEDIANAATMEEWRRSVEEEQEEKREIRKREIESLVEIASTYRKELEYSWEVLEKVRTCTENCNTKKLQDIVVRAGTYTILGYSTHNKPSRFGSGRRVVLEQNEIREVVWSTKAIDKILEGKIPTTTEKVGKRQIHWIWTREPLQVCIEAKKSFCAKDGRVAFWNPIHIVHIPLLGGKEDMQKAIDAESWMYREAGGTEYAVENATHLLLVDLPDKGTKALDMPEGEYKCTKYGETVYRGKQRTLLCLDGGGGEKFVYGHFLEEEVDRIDELDSIRSPLYCKLGAIRTTKNGKRDRMVALVA